MKQLTCEVCGSNELMKQDGIFVCQVCGCKFSLEDVRKMMIEGPVEVTGNVQVDNTSTIDNYLSLAETNLDSGDYSQAYDYARRVLDIDSYCTKAWRIEFISCTKLDKFSYADWITTGKSAIKYSSETEKQAMEELVYSTFIKEAEETTKDDMKIIDDALRDLVGQEHDAKKLAKERVSADMYALQMNCIRAEVNLLCANMNVANIPFAAEQRALKLWDSVPVDAFKDNKSFRYKAKVWLNKSNDVLVKYSETYASFVKSMSALNMPYSKYDKGSELSKCKTQQKDISNRIKEAEQLAENERRNRIEAYWKEHAKEKEDLVQDKASLEKRINDIKTNIEDSQEYKKLNALETGIRNTEKELESLGMLKFKEKKALREKLDNLNIEIKQAQKAFQDVSSPLEQEIKSINTKIQEIVKKLNLES